MTVSPLHEWNALNRIPKMAANLACPKARAAGLMPTLHNMQHQNLLIK
jgi:hypothetical protein